MPVKKVESKEGYDREDRHMFDPADILSYYPEAVPSHIPRAYHERDGEDGTSLNQIRHFFTTRTGIFVSL